jgi:hypothetical protein
MKKVYPKLSAFCHERGYEFQVVDMRWGVRDEATEDHMTSELCMRELNECQRLSTGPNFVVSRDCLSGRFWHFVKNIHFTLYVEMFA